MPDDAPHKSHATGWIIGVVIALVLYVGSMHPVLISFHSRKGTWLPPSWEKPLYVFYKPAYWLWWLPPLNKISGKWGDLWFEVFDVKVSRK